MICVMFPETHQDVTICVLPFFHIYGLVVTMLSRLAFGMKLVTVPKFVPETFLSAQERYKASVLFLVPPIGKFTETFLKDKICKSFLLKPTAEIVSVLGIVTANLF